MSTIRVLTPIQDLASYNNVRQEYGECLRSIEREMERLRGNAPREIKKKIVIERIDGFIHSVRGFERYSSSQLRANSSDIDKMRAFVSLKENLGSQPTSAERKALEVVESILSEIGSNSSPLKKKEEERGSPQGQENSRKIFPAAREGSKIAYTFTREKLQVFVDQTNDLHSEDKKLIKWEIIEKIDPVIACCILQLLLSYETEKFDSIELKRITEYFWTEKIFSKRQWISYWISLLAQKADYENIVKIERELKNSGPIHEATKRALAVLLLWETYNEAVHGDLSIFLRDMFQKLSLEEPGKRISALISLCEEKQQAGRVSPVVDQSQKQVQSGRVSPIIDRKQQELEIEGVCTEAGVLSGFHEVVIVVVMSIAFEEPDNRASVALKLKNVGALTAELISWRKSRPSQEVFLDSALAWMEAKKKSRQEMKKRIEESDEQIDEDTKNLLVEFFPVAAYERDYLVKQMLQISRKGTSTQLIAVMSQLHQGGTQGEKEEFLHLVVKNVDQLFPKEKQQSSQESQKKKNIPEFLNWAYQKLFRSAEILDFQIIALGCTLEEVQFFCRLEIICDKKGLSEQESKRSIQAFSAILTGLRTTEDRKDALQFFAQELAKGNLPHFRALLERAALTLKRGGVCSFYKLKEDQEKIEEALAKELPRYHRLGEKRLIFPAMSDFSLLPKFLEKLSLFDEMLEGMELSEKERKERLQQALSFLCGYQDRDKISLLSAFIHPSILKLLDQNAMMEKSIGYVLHIGKYESTEKVFQALLDFYVQLQEIHRKELGSKNSAEVGRRLQEKVIEARKQKNPLSAGERKNLKEKLEKEGKERLEKDLQEKLEKSVHPFYCQMLDILKCSPWAFSFVTKTPEAAKIQDIRWWQATIAYVDVMAGKDLERMSAAMKTLLDFSNNLREKDWTAYCAMLKLFQGDPILIPILKGIQVRKIPRREFFERTREYVAGVFSVDEDFQRCQAFRALWRLFNQLEGKDQGFYYKVLENLRVLWKLENSKITIFHKLMQREILLLEYQQIVYEVLGERLGPFVEEVIRALGSMGLKEGKSALLRRFLHDLFLLLEAHNLQVSIAQGGLLTPENCKAQALIDSYLCVFEAVIQEEDVDQSSVAMLQHQMRANFLAIEILNKGKILKTVKDLSVRVKLALELIDLYFLIGVPTQRVEDQDPFFGQFLFTHSLMIGETPKEEMRVTYTRALGQRLNELRKIHPLLFFDENLQGFIRGAQVAISLILPQDRVECLDAAFASFDSLIDENKVEAKGSQLLIALAEIPSAYRKDVVTKTHNHLSSKRLPKQDLFVYAQIFYYLWKNVVEQSESLDSIFQLVSRIKSHVPQNLVCLRFFHPSERFRLLEQNLKSVRDMVTFGINDPVLKERSCEYLVGEMDPYRFKYTPIYLMAEVAFVQFARSQEGRRIMNLLPEGANLFLEIQERYIAANGSLMNTPDNPYRLYTDLERERYILPPWRFGHFPVPISIYEKGKKIHGTVLIDLDRFIKASRPSQIFTYRDLPTEPVLYYKQNFRELAQAIQTRYDALPSAKKQEIDENLTAIAEYQGINTDLPNLVEVLSTTRLQTDLLDLRSEDLDAPVDLRKLKLHQILKRVYEQKAATGAEKLSPDSPLYAWEEHLLKFAMNLKNRCRQGHGDTVDKFYRAARDLEVKNAPIQQGSSLVDQSLQALSLQQTVQEHLKDPEFIKRAGSRNDIPLDVTHTQDYLTNRLAGYLGFAASEPLKFDYHVGGIDKNIKNLSREKLLECLFRTLPWGVIIQKLKNSIKEAYNNNPEESRNEFVQELQKYFTEATPQEEQDHQGQWLSRCGIKVQYDPEEEIVLRSDFSGEITDWGALLLLKHAGVISHFLVQ